MCLLPRREPSVLGRYDSKDVLLKLPVGVKVRDMRWLSVWCRRFTVRKRKRRRRPQ